MTNIVCHIGLHKTASGTLQRQLFPACNGLNLLTTLDPPVRAFVQAVTRKDPKYFRPDEALRLLEGSLSHKHVNLLSNESLSGPPYAGAIERGLDHRTPVIDNLKSVFPEARIVIVLRRQDTLARSFYRQYIKRGGTVSIRKFFGLDSPDRLPIMSLDRFQFSVYLRHVFDSFGSRVLVLTFEEFVSDQAAFLGRLLGFIGVETPTISLRRENSTRLGYFGMEVTRLLNYGLRSMHNRGPIPGLPVKRRGRWREVSIIEYIHDRWPGKPNSGRQTPLTRAGQEVWDMCRDDNRIIDQELGLGLERFGYY